MTQQFVQQYIQGAWKVSQGTEFIQVEDLNSGVIVSKVTSGHPQDAADAAQAAQAAFAQWAAQPLTDRIERVRQFGMALTSRKDKLAETIAGEVGTALKISHIVQVDSPIRNVEHFIQAASDLAWEQQIGNSRVTREPLGVVACITPWNFPLHQIVLKIVPALLAGNTVVLKPSEMTPRTTALICEALHEAAFPPGVINVVNGTGQLVGAALATAATVDMVSFTGSTEAGKTVTALAAQTVKKVTTELGGKSPSLVLPGADLARAIKSTVASCMLNNGQTCNALTRLLVPASQRAEVNALLLAELAKLSIGSSLAEDTRVGPLISRRQSERVKGLIQEGVATGAVRINEPAVAPAEGSFVSPQAFWVEADNTLARTEVFGPVLSVTAYEGVEEGIRIANDTDFGLAGAVWGEPEEALAVARRIRAGQVDVNGARFNPLAPFGGFKQSGVGREGGLIGLEEFLEYKSIQTA